MKYYIVILLVLIAIISFSQDSQLPSWNGMYLNYDTYEGEFLKEKTTVFDFNYLYIFDLVDNNTNTYFCFGRDNYFSDDNKRIGGGAWGRMIVKDNTIQTYSFSYDTTPFVFTFDKEFERFSFEDYSGPGEASFTYSKLFPLGNE